MTSHCKVNVQQHSSAANPTPSGARSRVAATAGRGNAEGVQGRFPRSARLLRHADFQRVYKQGRRHYAQHMTVFYVKCVEGQTRPRVGFTVPRALGGAVERNRIKRRMREVVRAELASLTVAADVVINPKKSAQTAELATLRKELARAFAVIQEKTVSAVDQRI